MTVFVRQEIVNFPAPQKLDPQATTLWYSQDCLWQCLCVGQEMVNFPAPQKTRPQAPKSSQNRGIFDVYAKPKTTSVAKTPLFATLSQHNMSEMLYFTVFLDHLLKNTGIYSVLWKHCQGAFRHAWLPREEVNQTQQSDFGIAGMATAK